MDDFRFDGLASVFSSPSRRGIFAGAAMGALASLMAIVGRGGPEATRAAKRKKRKSGAKSSPGPAGPPGPQGPQGAQGPPGPAQVAYAHVNFNGTFDPARSKGVNGIEKIDNLYCFNLDFSAKVAVGSPFINNSGVVATWTSPDSATFTCPETHRDAAARTFASNTGTSDGTITFKIVFF